MWQHWVLHVAHFLEAEGLTACAAGVTQEALCARHGSPNSRAKSPSLMYLDSLWSPATCLASCWFSSLALVLLDVQRLLETVGGLLAAELVAERESEVATLALANHNCRAACACSLGPLVRQCHFIMHSHCQHLSLSVCSCHISNAV